MDDQFLTRKLSYAGYPKELQSPHLLTKDELGEQLRKYCETLGLSGIYSAKVLSTQYDANEKRWTLKVQTPSGEISVTSKHLVQATGVGSQKPYLPPAAITGREVYKGISVHSSQFKSAQELKARGVKVSETPIRKFDRRTPPRFKMVETRMGWLAG